MSPSPADDAAVEIGVGIVGIMMAYGIGLGIALAKNYRDPYYFFGWPSYIRTPVAIAAVYFGFRLVLGALNLCGLPGGLIRLCGLLQ